jgi:hypothetical protein
MPEYPRSYITLCLTDDSPQLYDSEHLMTQALAQKMYLIAKQVNDLNAKGKVKAHTGNEKGYAKLFSINNGCRVWAHHTRDDKLIVDLMYTASADDKHPDVVKAAVATFEQFAEDSGYQVSQVPWQHSIDKDKPERKQYFFEITTVGDDAIGELVDKVRIAFGTNPIRRNEA